MAWEVTLSKNSSLGPVPREDKGSRLVGVLSTAPPQPNEGRLLELAHVALQTKPGQLHPGFIFITFCPHFP